MLIRRGKIPRKKASKIAKKFDGKFPSRYLDKSLKEILKNIDLSEKEFDKICDKFTNTAVFKKHKNGTLIKNKNKDLIKIKYAS